MASSDGASEDSNERNEPAYDPPEYQVGARLSTVVIESFTDGIQAQQVLNWRIIKAFTPFTRSCVVLVELERDDDSKDAVLPQQVILKVYDRRYQAERLKQDSERWTWETERHARKVWLAKAEEAASKSVSGEGSSDSKEGDSGRMGEEEEPEDNVFEMEDDYQDSSRKYYDTELECYKRLTDLQGKRIPQLFASLRYDFGLEAAPDLPDLPYSRKPHALVMQYIEGAVTADEARREGESTWSLQHRYGRQSRQALVTFWKMAQQGICYCDIRGANLLFTSNRSIFIDFGHSLLRPEDWDEEDWYGPTSSHGREFREYLHALRLRDITPPRMEWTSDAGWSRSNLCIAKFAQSEEWRDRWVKALVQPRIYLRCLKHWRRNINQPPYFEFTPAIDAWLDEHDLNRHDYTKARPGSPSGTSCGFTDTRNPESDTSNGEDSDSDHVTSSSRLASSATSDEGVPEKQSSSGASALAAGDGESTSDSNRDANEDYRDMGGQAVQEGACQQTRVEEVEKGKVLGA